MIVDWFTVAAQAINFLILVWLLKRFLYLPILNAIDAREKRIADEINDADARKAEAQKERDEFQRRNEEFDREREAKFQKIAKEAASERERLFEEARKAATAFSARRQAAMKNEEQNLQLEIVRRTQEEVFEIARKALADLAGAELEDRIVEVFLKRLTVITPEDRAQLNSSVSMSSAPVIVRSAFDLPAALRTSVQTSIKDLVGPDREVRFEVSAHLISGIEVTVDGRRISWSLEDYLTSLANDVGEILHNGDAKEPKPEAEQPDDSIPEKVSP